jgi:hypothetical protein
MFQVVRKNRFNGQTFVLAVCDTIQAANALKQRMNAMTSNKGGGWRKSDEQYVVEVA